MKRNFRRTPGKTKVGLLQKAIRHMEIADR